MKSLPKSIAIASGGTGGHLFPAQALARERIQMGDSVVFVGSGLATNRFFHKDLFAYQEVDSASLSYKRPLRMGISLVKGICQSYRILKKEDPDLVVGFGSFHSFPVLVAAVLRKIPMVLFESNAYPGRVNRWFSRWAKYSAVQFKEAQEKLSGKSMQVKMPLWLSCKEDVSVEKAREFYGLDPKGNTLLVFGGSQGAVSISRVVMQALGNIWQVIHLLGKKDSLEKTEEEYRKRGISACVKVFEEHMEYAWRAADAAVCRAGAATLSELVHFCVPAVLIPYPNAAEQHQLKNARCLERIGGALVLEEKELSADRLSYCLQELQKKKGSMCRALQDWKKGKAHISLSSLLDQIALKTEG